MPQHPVSKFHFQVEWGGSKIGFTEVTGLGLPAESIEYRDEASRENHRIKMPGMQKFSTITMKRGIFTGDNNFKTWWNTVTLNKTDRSNLIISLLNEKQEVVAVWKVKNAWPVKVQSTDLKADGNEVAIETIEVSHEGVTIQNEAE
jgi:phage tail-like protein